MVYLLGASSVVILISLVILVNVLDQQMGEDMGNYYMDFDLIKKYPNKYNLIPKMIKKLKILDWERLKKHTWYNEAMKKTGKWWCHLEGCNIGGKYDDMDEFWIGFNEENNKIDYHFTCWEGMGGYNFTEFYKGTENRYDLQVQVNAIKYLNMLLDEKILELGE